MKKIDAKGFVYDDLTFMVYGLIENDEYLKEHPELYQETQVFIPAPKLGLQLFYVVRDTWKR